MHIDEFLSRFEGIKSIGHNQWVALCPAHDDHNPSLSIRVVDSKILLHCHAGCANPRILGAKGLDMSALFLEDAPFSADEPQETSSRAVEYAENEIREGATCFHDYRSEGGDLLYRVVRYDPPEGKRYAVYSPRIGDLWVPGLNGTQAVLYNLPQLGTSGDETIFVVEGEKCADSLSEHSLVATCNTFGAGKWKQEYGEYMRGRRVVILPDNDEPGHKHAAQVKQSIEGVAASVMVLDLPGLPEKGDVADWLEAGHTAEDLRSLATLQPTSTTWADMDRVIAPIEWDWEGWLPRGMVVILSGACESGKSMLALRIAASYMNRDSWPDGSRFTGSGGEVVWCEAEAAQATNLDRARAWGLPIDKIRTPFSDPLKDIRLDTDEGMAAVRVASADPSVRLVVVDSLSASHGLDENSSRIVLLLLKLAEIARDTGTPILIIHHFNKPGAKEQPAELTIDRLRGSSAIPQVARVIWAVDSPDPAKREHRRLSVIKNNLAKRPEPVGFKLLDNRTVFTVAPAPPRKITAIEEAKKFLIDLLGSGFVAAASVRNGASTNGISTATLNRAKKLLGIVSVKDGDTWNWSLPVEREGVEEVEYLEEDDHVDDLQAGTSV